MTMHLNLCYCSDNNWFPLDLLGGMRHTITATKVLTSMKRRMKTIIGLSLLSSIMLLTSCATDVANRYYGTVRYPPKNLQEVEILWQKPTRDFFVIADFQSRGEGPEAIREKAAQIGADAVIISILGGYYSRSEEWASYDSQGNTYSRITGTAIKYK